VKDERRRAARVGALAAGLGLFAPALVKSTGTAACLLGKTWGYDDAGVWVTDGCSGEFQLGQAAAAVAPTPAPRAG
jgi:hypothetical protein